MQLNPGNRTWHTSDLGMSYCITLKVACAALFLLCLTTVSSSMAQEPSVTSSVSATTITRDESVTLTIVARGLDAELDASSLGQDFDVVGRSSSRDVSRIIGANNQIQSLSVVTWALELIPRDTGVFTVPAVKVGDLTSQAHTLTVNDLPTGAQRDIFVEASVDTAEPWVQAQVVMTIRVFQSIDIVDGGLDTPAGADLVVERIGDDTRSTAEREGKRYSVTERKFALFPQKSGQIIIEPITLSVSVPAQANAVRSFFSQTRRITRRTDRITLNVQPRPDAGAAWWLPAKAVQLDSQWVGDISNATVDQPLTRRIVMRASGVADTQLPEVSIPAIDGVSLYAEQPERSMGADGGGLIAQQIINWALIPQRAGMLELPAVTVDWFNTQSGRVESATLAAETITVNAASAASSQASIPDAVNDAAIEPANSQAADVDSAADLPALDVSLTADDALAEQAISGAMRERLEALEAAVVSWRVVALLLVALWVVTVLYYLWWRRQQAGFKLGALKNAGTESIQRMKPLADVAVSAKAGDLPVLRQSLLEWSARQWPDDPPLTLNFLAARLPGSDAQKTLAMIDSALYSRSEVGVHPDLFAEKLTELPDQLKQALSSQDGTQERTTDDRLASTASRGLPRL